MAVSIQTFRGSTVYLPCFTSALLFLEIYIPECQCSVMDHLSFSKTCTRPVELKWQKTDVLTPSCSVPWSGIGREWSLFWQQLLPHPTTVYTDEGKGSARNHLVQQSLKSNRIHFISLRLKGSVTFLSLVNGNSSPHLLKVKPGAKGLFLVWEY